MYMSFDLYRFLVIGILFLLLATILLIFALFNEKSNMKKLNKYIIDNKLETKKPDVLNLDPLEETE